jgi:U3 small nucleolar RNA-associated protein 20
MLELLMTVSANQNINIVQWSFNCLAYLFKYLSRLLTVDLRPTYKLISPILGKSHQREFVTRFAAESLSFLIRKCTGDSLKDIVETILQDVVREKVSHNELFFNSVVLLFSDSIKSSGYNLHSRAGSIVSVLLGTAFNSQERVYLGDLVFHVFVDVLQHARQETSEPLYLVCYTFVKEHIPTNVEERYFDIQILLALAGLRKGSRVVDWNTMLECSHSVVATRFPDGDQLICVDPEISLVLSLLLCPEFQVLVKYSSKLLDCIFGYDIRFISFCKLVFQHNRQIFKDHVVRFVAKFASKEITDESIKRAFLLLLVDLQNVTDSGEVLFSLSVESPILEQILSNIERCNITKDEEIEELYLLARTVQNVPEMPSKYFDSLTNVLKSMKLGSPSTVKATTVSALFSIVSKEMDQPQLDEVLLLAVEELRTTKHYQLLPGIYDILQHTRYVSILQTLLSHFCY